MSDDDNPTEGDGGELEANEDVEAATVPHVSGDKVREVVESFSEGLASITGDIDEEVDAAAWLAVRAQVGRQQQRFSDMAKDIDAQLDLNSAKDRLRAYLLDNIHRTLAHSELAGVAGISEWQRRMRELATDEGWQTVAGPNHDKGLRSGEYRLEADTVDTEKVERLALLRRIRGQGGSALSRLLELLKASHPYPVSKYELSYVAKISEWPRRIRELAEDGFDIESSVDNSELPAGTYKLVSLTQGEPRSREAIKQRAAILERDGRKCRDCGARPAKDKDVKLQIHHIHAVNAGGDNRDENLVTLCSNCHAGRHAIEPHGMSKVRDDLLHPSDDLGEEAVTSD